MNRDQVNEHLRGLDALVGEPPPMLTLVVLANGTGIAYGHDWLTSSLGDTERLVEIRKLLQNFMGMVSNVDMLLGAVARVTEEDGR